MRVPVRLTVLIVSVLLMTTGQGWAFAVQPSVVPVAEIIPRYETLLVETECEVEPRTTADLIARMDVIEASGAAPGTSSGPLTVVESDKRGNYLGIPVYPNIFIDGSLWIDDGLIAVSEATLPGPSATAADGVKRTVQLLNACGGFLERPLLYGLYTDTGLEQDLRFTARYGFDLLRLLLDEYPPVNDHEASEPTGTRLYSMVVMSDGRVAVVISITEPPNNTNPHKVLPYVAVLKEVNGVWKFDWRLVLSHVAYPYVDPAATPTVATPTPVR